MGKHLARATQEPGVVREVDDSALIDLDRQGLIYSSESGEYGKHKWKGEAAEVAPAEKEGK